MVKTSDLCCSSTPVVRAANSIQGDALSFGRSENRYSGFVRGREILSSPERSDWLLDPPSYLSSGCRGGHFGLVVGHYNE